MNLSARGSGCTPRQEQGRAEKAQGMLVTAIAKRLATYGAVADAALPISIQSPYHDRPYTTAIHRRTHEPHRHRRARRRARAAAQDRTELQCTLSVSRREVSVFHREPHQAEKTKQQQRRPRNHQQKTQDKRTSQFCGGRAGARTPGGARLTAVGNGDPSYGCPERAVFCCFCLCFVFFLFFV